MSTNAKRAAVQGMDRCTGWTLRMAEGGPATLSRHVFGAAGVSELLAWPDVKVARCRPKPRITQR